MNKTAKTPGRVVVITDHRDAHLPFVERYLDQPFTIIDPQELLKGTPLTYRISKGRTVVIYDGQELENITGVWFRKPLPLDVRDMPIDDAYKKYSQGALQRHMNQMLTCFEEATWVSDYYAQIRANNKSLQMALAERLGMNVPDTIITSSKEAAQDFINKHPQSIVKSLTVDFPTIDGKMKLFFTTLINKDFRPDLTNLALGPAIFQQAIKIGTDIRVIVVGDKVFAASVHTRDIPSDNHVYDYRLGNYQGKVTLKALKDFPPELARLCVEHTKQLGLNFGAIDLVQDEKGVYWFLENNPNGQWAFVEDDTDQPIGKAMADLLQNRN